MVSTTIAPHMPVACAGNHSFEYELAIFPDKALGERINATHQAMCLRYNQPPGQYRPRIVLASFKAHEAMEETITRYLQRILAGQPAFYTSLNNFGGKPPQSICLRLIDVQPFALLAQQWQPVDSYIKGCGFDGLQRHAAPHLSVGPLLPAQQYFSALMEYSQCTFHASFLVSQIQLLRTRHQGDALKTVQLFHLQQAIHSIAS